MIASAIVAPLRRVTATGATIIRAELLGTALIHLVMFIQVELLKCGLIYPPMVICLVIGISLEIREIRVYQCKTIGESGDWMQVIINLC